MSITTNASTSATTRLFVVCCCKLSQVFADSCGMEAGLCSELLGSTVENANSVRTAHAELLRTCNAKL